MIVDLCHSLVSEEGVSKVSRKKESGLDIMKSTGLAEIRESLEDDTAKLPPPGLSRIPSAGSVFKPSFLFSQEQESEIEALIGLNVDELHVNEVVTIPQIQKVHTSHPQANSEVCEVHHVDSRSKPIICYQRSFSKNWVPDQDDIELFDCVLSILKTYTLGIKELIGVRQVLRNKFGDAWVNRFNKKLSSKSLLWRYSSNERRLADLIRTRAKKFTLVVKKETSMFYLCVPELVPNGFTIWRPSSHDFEFDLHSEARRLSPPSWGSVKPVNTKILQQSHDSRVRL
jgi:hypothetical protein